MSLGYDTMRAVVQCMLNSGARVNVVTQGRGRKGEAVFTKEGFKLRCVIPVDGELDLLSMGKTLIRMPEKRNVGDQSSVEITFDPGDLRVDVTASNVFYLKDAGAATIYFHLRSDPVADEYRERERQKNASKYHSVS